jgi:hypothetical protein
VSRVSKPAGHNAGEPTWKSAIQQVWKPALRKPGKSALNRYAVGWGFRRRLRLWRDEWPGGKLTVLTFLTVEDLTIGSNFCQGIVGEKAELRMKNAECGDFATDFREMQNAECKMQNEQSAANRSQCEHGESDFSRRPMAKGWAGEKSERWSHKHLSDSIFLTEGRDRETKA